MAKAVALHLNTDPYSRWYRDINYNHNQYAAAYITEHIEITIHTRIGKTSVSTYRPGQLET